MSNKPEVPYVLPIMYKNKVVGSIGTNILVLDLLVDIIYRQQKGNLSSLPDGNIRFAYFEILNEDLSRVGVAADKAGLHYQFDGRVIANEFGRDSSGKKVDRPIEVKMTKMVYDVPGRSIRFDDQIVATQIHSKLGVDVKWNIVEDVSVFYRTETGKVKLFEIDKESFAKAFDSSKRELLLNRQSYFVVTSQSGIKERKLGKRIIVDGTLYLPEYWVNADQNIASSHETFSLRREDIKNLDTGFSAKLGDVGPDLYALLKGEKKKEKKPVVTANVPVIQTTSPSAAETKGSAVSNKTKQQTVRLLKRGAKLTGAAAGLAAVLSGVGIGVHQGIQGIQRVDFSQYTTRFGLWSEKKPVVDVIATKRNYVFDSIDPKDMKPETAAKYDLFEHLVDYYVVKGKFPDFKKEVITVFNKNEGFVTAYGNIDESMLVDKKGNQLGDNIPDNKTIYIKIPKRSQTGGGQEVVVSEKQVVSDKIKESPTTKQTVGVRLDKGLSTKKTGVVKPMPKSPQKDTRLPRKEKVSGLDIQYPDREGDGSSFMKDYGSAFGDYYKRNGQGVSGRAVIRFKLDQHGDVSDTKVIETELKGDKARGFLDGLVTALDNKVRLDDPYGYYYLEIK